MKRCFPIFQACVFFLFLFMPAGCDSDGQNRPGTLGALVDSVEKDYSNRRWDIRRAAVERVVVFFSDKDVRDMKFLMQAKEYGRIIKFLETATQDMYGSVRIESLSALALLRPESAYNRIAEMALRDPDGNVRWRAVETLSLYRDERSVDVFYETVKSDDWVVREASVRGMLLLDETIQRKRLIKTIADAMRDPNDNVSCAALSGPGVRDRQLYQAAADVLRTRKKPSAKLLSAIMKALNGYILEDDIRRIVISNLSHQDKEVRIQALRLLKKEKSLKKKQGAESF